MSISEVLKSLTALLRAPVYLVGGAVRDLILGRKPKDLDFATPLPAEEVAKRLKNKGYPVSEAGLAYGVVSTVLPGVGAVDLAMLRRDLDGSRRTRVAPGSLLDDLSRRDFTVNAMALTVEGEIVDPFGGREDLRKGVIRAVGNPEKRFREDPIRVLRAVRFAAQLGFRMDPGTWAAAVRVAPQVIAVSAPRLAEEVGKGLTTPDPVGFVKGFLQLGVLYDVFPELVGPHGPAHLLMQNPLHHPEGDVLTHLGQVAGRAAQLARQEGIDPLLAAWAGFLHDVGKPATAAPAPAGDYYTFHRHEAVGAKMVPGLAARFGWPRAWREALEVVVRLHMRPLQPATPRAVRRFLAEAGNHLPLLRVVVLADGEGRREDLEAWFLEDAPTQPLLRGRDLLALGVPPGPGMGDLLRRAYELQLELGLKTREEVLEALGLKRATSG